jgi:hypothetical protein
MAWLKRAPLIDSTANNHPIRFNRTLLLTGKIRVDTILENAPGAEKKKAGEDNKLLREGEPE